MKHYSAIKRNGILTYTAWLNLETIKTKKRGGEVTQTMYTHVSKCNNDKIKFKIKGGKRLEAWLKR
jgi:hypothetical protein